MFKNEEYVAYSSTNNKYVLTPKELSILLKDNIIKKKRAVYIGHLDNKKINTGSILDIKKLPGSITISDGISVDVNIETKTIIFNQTNSTDWALLKEGDYGDWNIYFNGLKKTNNSSGKEIQRFNNHGLTGCLTVYKSKINNTTFDINNGGCEDSINILNSVGNDLIISINNSYADAVDFDFSSLTMKKLKVKKSGNDCFDVSMGDYLIEEALLENCGDKGISVGEKSSLKIDNISIQNAQIALAVKDLSILSVNNLETKNISSCGEAYQKKQEFGGGVLEIQKSNCLPPVISDQNSTYIGN